MPHFWPIGLRSGVFLQRTSDFRTYHVIMDEARVPRPDDDRDDRAVRP